MKRKILALMITLVAATAFTACGDVKQQSTADTTATETAPEVATDAAATTEAGAEMAGDMEVGDYPANDFEDRVGKTSFESYDEIIGLLEGDEAYAYVDVKGYDGQVLLVASNVYDDLLGHFATIDCTPYTRKLSGEITADSAIYSDSTATPIAIDDEGIIYMATHMSMEKTCYGENGTANPAMMSLAYVYTEERDDNGVPKSVGGFVRTKNSVVDDDIRDVNPDEIDLLSQMFDEYSNTEVINFTKVNGEMPAAK